MSINYAQEGRTISAPTVIFFVTVIYWTVIYLIVLWLKHSDPFRDQDDR